MADSELSPLDRNGMAAWCARDIPEGWLVNLGIGIPTLVADFVPAEREVIFHAENGVIGVGPAPAPDAVNPFLINASTTHVTLRTGGSYVHHADSFAIARGGHLDLCVLGAFEVAENGDIANWARSADEPVKQVGGAMDLAIGAQRLWVVMEHITKDGESRIRQRCSYPLTAKGVVKRVYTNLAVLDVTPRGFVVRDMIPGMTLEALQARTEAKLHAEERSMITAIEITSRAPFVGGATFGTTGAYERLDGVAIGELDPAHPGNRGIVNIDKAPRNARGRVEYRSDICILRPADPEQRQRPHPL